MQQQGLDREGVGGGGSQQSQYGVPHEIITSMAQQQMVVEAASPISSRPPAASHSDERMPFSDYALAAAAEADRGGGVGGGGGVNRWPRQETLALLKIRSEMDATFRDVTLKGPLWEDVSRKLTELGYKRSAKKCKEKFENVHKYYKRTKEGRGGRQDGKSYKFFSQLEALHGTMTTANTSSTTAVASINPVSIGIGGISNPMPISSIRHPPTGIHSIFPSNLTNVSASMPPATTVIGSAPPSATATATATGNAFGISFSSNSSSSSQGYKDSDDDDEDLEYGEPSNMGSNRKRKRGSTGGRSSSKMMEFFEGLIKQVMQKQDAMQQRFLEAIEKRDEDRMIRDEAWKRQEMGRLAHEHELMAQERSISASRDAAIVAFLQKITGQTIQLPQPVSISLSVPPPRPTAPIPVYVSALPHTTPSPPMQQQPQYELQRKQQSQKDQIVMDVQEQQTAAEEFCGGSGTRGGTSEPPSSRWPKTEVLALIKLRSGMEAKYQESVPKGPLWEEISGEMNKIGYKRSSKRCKEKWENINKYFKKVKESNKTRPEDAKTCPYFHELDALYRKKVFGSTSSLRLEQQQPQEDAVKPPIIDDASNPIDIQGIMRQSEDTHHATNAAFAPTLSREGATGPSNKPEDIVKEVREHEDQQLMVDDYSNIEEDEYEYEENDDEEDDDNDDEALEEERKMGYKIEEYERQNRAPSTRAGTGVPSFLAMVQ